MDTGIQVEFAKIKGVIARKLFLEIDGQQHEVQWGTNQLPLSPGAYRLRAYGRAPLGNKICATKELEVNVARDQVVELIFHAVGGTFAKDFRLEIKGHEASPPEPMPAWAWVFIVVCGAIPVVSLGGAIPAMIGFTGAFGCAAVSRNRSLPAGVRLGSCLAIAAAAWGAFALLILVFIGR